MKRGDDRSRKECLNTNALLDLVPDEHEHSESEHLVLVGNCTGAVVQAPAPRKYGPFGKRAVRKIGCGERPLAIISGSPMRATDVFAALSFGLRHHVLAHALAANAQYS